MNFRQHLHGGFVQLLFTAAIGQHFGKQRVPQILQDDEAVGVIGGIDIGGRQATAAQPGGCGHEAGAIRPRQPRHRIVAQRAPGFFTGAWRRSCAFRTLGLVHQHRFLLSHGQPRIAAGGGIAGQGRDTGRTPAGARQKIHHGGFAI